MKGLPKPEETYLLRVRFIENILSNTYKIDILALGLWFWDGAVFRDRGRWRVSRLQIPVES